MGWHFVTSSATVHLHHSVGVDGEPLVGVDHDAEQTRIGLRGEASKKGIVSGVWFKANKGMRKELLGCFWNANGYYGLGGQ